MRGFFNRGAVLALAAGMIFPTLALPISAAPMEVAATPQRRKKRVSIALPQTHERFRRSRGPQAKRKGRTNLLHVSQRTRRKHRRAKRA